MNEFMKNENKSEREKVEYTELNKTVTKRCRQISRKKRTDHVEIKLQCGRGPKQMYKGGPVDRMKDSRKRGGGQVREKESGVRRAEQNCERELFVGCLTSQQQASVSQG